MTSAGHVVVVDPGALLINVTSACSKRQPGRKTRARACTHTQASFRSPRPAKPCLSCSCFPAYRLCVGGASAGRARGRRSLQRYQSHAGNPLIIQKRVQNGSERRLRSLTAGTIGPRQLSASPAAGMWSRRRFAWSLAWFWSERRVS